MPKSHTWYAINLGDLTRTAEESKTQGIATTSTDSDESLIVNIEKFGNILKWFGPLVQSPFPPDGLSILTKIRLLLMEP